MALRSTYKHHHADTKSAASSLDVLASSGLCAVLYIEHRHAIRSSTLLALYLGVRLLLEAAESRSYFLRDLVSLGGITAAMAATRLTLLIIEEIPKQHLIIDPEIWKLSSGEATSGFWCRTFFFLLGPIFYLGYHGVLKTEGLVSLGIEFSSVRLFAGLSKRWKSFNQSRRHSLLLACCWEWKGALCAVLIPRVILSVLTFSQPISIQKVVEAIEDERIGDDESGRLVAAVTLTFAGSALCRAVSKHMTIRLLTRVRGGLLSVLLDKNMKLRLSDARRNAIVTLMSADFDGIANGLPSCVEIPITFLETGLGMFLLTRFVQQSSFVIIFPLIFATLINIICGKYMRAAQRKWNESIQTRVTKTSRVLSQLPAIKMLGLGPRTTEFIQHLRIREIKTAKKYRTIQSGVIYSATLADLLCPTILVAAALFRGAFGDLIMPAMVYPTLAIVALVQLPLSALFRSYPAAMTTLGCFERLREFLCHEEHRDPRILQIPHEVEDDRSPHQDSLMERLEGRERQSPGMVHFDDVSLTIFGSDKPILSGINFTLFPGSMAALFGPTGSGKTSFINSILGEVEILSGTLHVEDTAIALVGQSTWLPNLSLLECIVGACEYNDVWFRTVVTACHLLQDIAQLPGGVDYVVGSGGLALSGGQRQRVSMARATYCRAKLILLDDSFSALDRTTATAILFNLCGENGLLRQSNTAVVVVSYLPECLEIADNIIYLDGHGNFSHQTSQATKALSSQILSLLRQEAALEEKADADNKETTIQAAQTVTSTGMQRVEVTKRKQGDKALCRFWLREIGCATFTTWLCMSTIHGVLDSFPRVYMKIWVDNAPANRLYFIGYALLPFVCGIFCFAGVLFMFNHVSSLAALGLHQKLAKTVMLSTLGFLSVVDSGSILNMFGLDMDILTKGVPPAVHNTLYYGIGAVVKLVIISSGAAYMTLLIPPILLALVFIQRYSLRTSRHLRQLELESQAPLVTAVRETSDGLVYIRSFGWEGQTQARAHFLLDRSQKPVYLLYASQQVLGLSTDLVAAAMAILLTVLSLYIKHGRSANSVGVSFLSIVVVGSTLNQLVVEWTSLEMMIGALSRIRSFVTETPIESGEDTCSLPEDWPSRGEVLLENVSARYRNETGEPYVVRNVSVTINPGQKFGITGRTGSGKSSLMYSLLGFLDFQGSIKIDGVDIRNAPRDELRARIVTISQDQVELDGTVRDNLLPFDTRWDDEAVTPDEEDKAETALRDRIARETLVRLRIWDKVESKGGLMSMLEDVGYSHGEMQLLCIARAVVRRRLTGSNLLLVDEATGGVDRWRDQIVREMMKEYFRGCTIIVIAHREESIADSNVMVEMANGEMKTPRVFY
ncbi:multidrug resistance protein MDR, putative [Beauveria bassiana ARSEF 2860]|uniref:Multidrug resistance protein MDR, putative n=1 Tax=Beauveria bassiana (strain ARSEF 2860) TaxID=655819 RepID=J4KQ41_BEAB2|nr:multidrug resistance protein MDR, putative [Beauveria bassiana ARSEF 2860]EJP68544.1 multidrug resistance protein MDR, putative [Beauveria bassiana ARSEF 2860]